VASVAFTPTAAQRNESAQVNLGMMYTKERGVEQDFVRAHMWFNSLPQHRPAILEVRRQRIEIELRQK
jgi:TPR repeat protein